MSDLRDLYQEVVLDHGRAPRNFRAIEHATADAEGFNPLCGDRVHVYLTLDGDRIADVAFQGDGCAISKASASLMTQAVKGRTRAETGALFDGFHRMVTGGAGDGAGGGAAGGGAGPAAGGTAGGGDAVPLGKLEAFAGVADYPVRVKCASLAWHTLKAALAGESQPVSTE